MRDLEVVECSAVRLDLQVSKFQAWLITSPLLALACFRGADLEEERLSLVTKQYVADILNSSAQKLNFSQERQRSLNIYTHRRD